MLVKEKVIETIQALPDKFSIDEVVERLIILHKIEIGLQQVEEGKTFAALEAREKMKKWLK